MHFPAHSPSHFIRGGGNDFTVLLMRRPFISFLWSLPQVARSPRDFRSVCRDRGENPQSQNEPRGPSQHHSSVQDGSQGRVDRWKGLRSYSQPWTECAHGQRSACPPCRDQGPGCPAHELGYARDQMPRMASRHVHARPFQGLAR